MIEIRSIEPIEKHKEKLQITRDIQKEVFCESLKKDGLDLTSALKRCGIDLDSMVEDEDDNANAKKMKHYDN